MSSVAAESDASPEKTAPRTMSPFLRATYFLGPPSLVLCSLLISPRLALTIPPILAPTALAYYYYHRMQPASKRVPEENFTRTYVTALLTGVPVAGLAQVVLGYSFLYLFHGKDTLKFLAEAAGEEAKNTPIPVLASRAASAWGWKEVLQRAWTMIVCAGLVEEVLHGRGVMHAVNRESAEASTSTKQSSGEPARRKRRLTLETHLQLGVAVGLGFGTMESIVAAYGLVTAGHSWKRLMLELGVRIVHGNLAHTLMTVLSALRMARGSTVESPARTLDTGKAESPEPGESGKETNQHERAPSMSIIQAIMPSVLYHGLVDFALLSISAMNGHLGWVYPKDTPSLVAVYGIGGSALALLALHVRWEWCKLKEEEKGSLRKTA